MQSEHNGHSTDRLLRLLQDHAMQDESHRAIAMMLNRLFVEVEALRAALADPAVPESVRSSYRKAYVDTTIDAHCSVGIGHTILSHFFAPTATFYGEDLMMLERLGMSDAEIAAVEAEVEKVSRYT